MAKRTSRGRQPSFRPWVWALVAALVCLSSLQACRAKQVRPEVLRQNISMVEGAKRLHAEAEAAQHQSTRQRRELKDSAPADHVGHRRVHLCQHALAAEKGLIAGAGRHNIDWMNDMGALVFAYQSHNPQLPHFYDDGGFEAGAYLQFIVDYFDCLPKTMAFLHGHQESWHNHDMAQTLRKLRWERVDGHHDLNRIMPVWTHALGALSPIPNVPVIADQPDAYNGSFNVHQIMRGKVYDYWEVYVWLQMSEELRTWDHLFGPLGMGALPDDIDFVCCAQFVVDRATIRRHPLAFWKQLLEFTQDNDVRANHHAEKRWTVGDVFVAVWAQIFGRPAKAGDWNNVPECELFECDPPPEE